MHISLLNPGIQNYTELKSVHWFCYLRLEITHIRGPTSANHFLTELMSECTFYLHLTDTRYIL